MTTPYQRQDRPVWLDPGGFWFFGLGPIGSVCFFLTALISGIVAVGPAGPDRAAVIAVGGLILTGGFAKKDRHGRNVYNRMYSRMKWWAHRGLGFNVHDGSWLSVRPLEQIDLPGLLSDMTMVEQETAAGNVAVGFYPAGNVAVFTLQVEPPDDSLSDGTDVGRIQQWEEWLNRALTEPNVETVTVTQVSARTAKHTTEMATIAVVGKSETEASWSVFDEIVDELAGSVSPSVYISIAMQPPKSRRKAHRWFANDITGPLIQRFIDGLADAGAGKATPVTVDQLSRLWFTQWNPTKLEAVTENPEVVSAFEDCGPPSFVEKPWGTVHGDAGTVGVVSSTKPTRWLDSTLFEQLAKPVEGVESIRVAVTYQPVSALEALTRKASHNYGLSLHDSTVGRRSGAADAKAEDADAADAAAARGAVYAQIGVSIAGVLVDIDEQAARMAAERLIGRASGPLGTLLFRADLSHQSVALATMPGALPIMSALTPIEELG